MNKHHYKIIFSRVLNQLIVVSELAKSQGKAAAENLEKVVLKTSAKQTALSSLMKPVYFGLMLALGFVFVPAAFADELAIHADTSAPGNQQPIVLSTANGLPQVNIQTPSAAGVSRNQYSQFDVAEKGAILNNARKPAQTELAGWVSGNPNLATGEAKIILNEVNSANPSRLQGYVEVAGKKADVVIANPSGIQCDGCGVINAARMTFTTGKPQVENGELKGYDVKGGNVAVGQKGFDSSRADYADIIAEKVQIEGGVWAKNLKVSTGKNHVNRTHESVVYVGGQNAAENDHTSTPNESNYGVDVAQLGGMYAGQIQLIDNGHGLGVRNAGHIGAAAGDVQIDSQGRIVNSGVINAEQQIAARSGQDLTNQGKLEARQGDIQLNARQIEQQGALVAQQQNVRLRAQTAITQGG